MKSHEKNLTQGNLWKQILFFSVPLMFSNVLQVLFNMADVAVVGRFGGPVALGAVGSTTTLITLFTGVLLGLAGGVNVLVALFAGSKNKKELRETIHTAFIVCFITGILLTLSGILFSKNILLVMNTKAELLEGASTYLRIYLLGMPALAIYNHGNAVLSAMGDTKRPLYYLTFAGIINVVLNLFFVIVCKLDVIGVALASIIAQYISAILILKTLCRNQGDFALHFSELRLVKDKVLRLLKVGIPSAMQYAIFAFANLFVQIGVNSFDAITVAGNSAAANSDALVYDMMAAFYTACATFIGQNYGAKNKNRIRKTFCICMLYSFVVGLVLGVSLYIFGKPFLSLFADEPAVIEAGMLRLSVMALSYAVSAFMDNTIAASRGFGKTLVPTFMVIMGACVFRIVWYFTVFAHFKTITSLYLVYVCSWVTTFVFEFIYYLYIYKKETKNL